MSDFEESLGESTGSEEETLEGEIAMLQQELGRAHLKEKTKGTSGEQDKPPPYPLSDAVRTSPDPPTQLGSEEAPQGGVKCYTMIAPIMKIPDPNNPGQVFHLH